MRVALFSTKPYTRRFFEEANQNHDFELNFLEPQLTAQTCALADGYDVVCAFVNDRIDAQVVQCLAAGGVKLIAMRCAGFNNVDLHAAKEAGIGVVRVPAYSPHAVAEHTLALILALNRRIPRAANRVRDGNFELESLMGFDIYGKTVGIIGTGRIGYCVAEIMLGMGCTVLGYDAYENDELKKRGVRYVALDALYRESDIVTLHCPLTEETHHLIDAQAIETMKHGVMLINTSRGGLVDTRAVIEGLKSRKIGYLGIDVYEEEEVLFFSDLSSNIIQDDVFARLLTFPNVLITGHQAFFTEEAFSKIAETTLANIHEFADTGASKNAVGE